MINYDNCKSLLKTHRTQVPDTMYRKIRNVTDYVTRFVSYVNHLFQFSYLIVSRLNSSQNTKMLTLKLTNKLGHENRKRGTSEKIP